VETKIRIKSRFVALGALCVALVALALSPQDSVTHLRSQNATTSKITIQIPYGLQANALFNAPTSTAGNVGLWAADWGGAAGKRTAAGWQAAALNYQLLVGQNGVYKKWITQLHAWNPKLIVLTYDLGPYLQKGSSNYNIIAALQPTWFAHDSLGRLINLPMFPSNYLMDMGSAGYRDWHARNLVAIVSAGGFDGAMADSMGSGPLGNYASGVPVNPATHTLYTTVEYLNNSVLTLNGDKALLNGKYLAFNGLISGPMYVQESQILATSNADAGVSELFLRQPTASVTSYPTAPTMAASLQMMTDMAAHGKAFLGWTKVWSSGTATQIAQWQQFALGTYFLGQQTASYIDFMPSHSSDNTAAPATYLQTVLGAPLTSWALSGSLYSRSFASGKTVRVDLTTNTATIG
jgi:hypothetical protein